MLIKLGIIAGLAVLGGMIFYTEINSLFPDTTSTMPDSLGADIENLGATATSFVGERFNQSATELGAMANETAGGIAEGLGGAQKQILGDSEGGPLDSIVGIFSGGDD